MLRVIRMSCRLTYLFEDKRNKKTHLLHGRDGNNISFQFTHVKHQATQNPLRFKKLFH